MTTQITATVVGGMLKPDQSLPLADQTRVNLTIEPIVQCRDVAAAWQALKARLQQRPIHAADLHYSRTNLHEQRR